MFTAELQPHPKLEDAHKPHKNLLSHCEFHKGFANYQVDFGQIFGRYQVDYGQVDEDFGNASNIFWKDVGRFRVDFG